MNTKEYGLDRVDDIREHIDAGTISASELKNEFGAYMSSRESIIADLNKMTKKVLIRRAGYGSRLSDKKESLVASVLHRLDMGFVPGSGITYGMGAGSWENAVIEKVATWTDDKIIDHANAIKERREAFLQSVENPQTIADFEKSIEYRGARNLNDQDRAELKTVKAENIEQWVRERGLRLLTQEQRERFDALRAEKTFEAEKEKRAQKASVSASSVSAEFEIVETVHTKKGHALYVAQIKKRVDRSDFVELKARAKKLGGYYSSYSRGGAVPGFQFTERESAVEFAGLEKVDGEEKAQASEEEKQANAASKLRTQAQRMQDKAEDSLNSDRKTNTVKRAREAASAIESAEREKAFALTLERIADLMERGECVFLQNIRHATEIATLDKVLRIARSKRKENLSRDERKAIDSETIGEKEIEAARLPYPLFYADQLADFAKIGSEIKGCKSIANKVRKGADYLSTLPKKYAYLSNADWREMVRELLKRIKHVYGNAGYMLERFEDFDRLARIGITNLPTLRTALREYLSLRETAKELDPIKAKELALVGRKIDGFFPTPENIARQVIELAEIEDGMNILEPSAGTGRLVSEALLAGAESITAIEVNHDLSMILREKFKGLPVVVSMVDFMNIEPYATFDRVVMNPPFEKRQDIDHILKAVKHLKTGGRLVAICANGPKQREVLEPIATAWIDLPANSFAESGTGVNAAIVVIDV
ncbi:RsmD family RNA methyltransferase [Puniceicoccaceae bacterium K14]|nr:RsmD family RNA methyltransferase [Puniceicoccaceae bacterium K14]